MVAIMESSHVVDTKINLIVTVVVIVALYAVGITTYCLYRTFFRKPIKDQEEDSTAVETSADIETERRIMDTMAQASPVIATVAPQPAQQQDNERISSYADITYN